MSARYELEPFHRNTPDDEFLNDLRAVAAELRASTITITTGYDFWSCAETTFKCRITGRSPATDPTVILEVDHIIPWERGGETVFDNLQTLAKDINSGKSNLAMHE